MIPLAITREELARMQGDRRAGEEARSSPSGTSVPFSFGTMIELPRAAIMAGELAKEAEFFSFGTNDLTQATMGLSRDDAGKFLPAYIESGILPKDPFVSLDQPGVGALVRMAIERGRKTNASIKLGICGEHGGDPASIRFFQEAGLNYVSCSPFRVAIARLAAAQAALAAGRRRRARLPRAALRVSHPRLGVGCASEADRSVKGVDSPLPRCPFQSREAEVVPVPPRLACGAGGQGGGVRTRVRRGRAILGQRPRVHDTVPDESATLPGESTLPRDPAP